MAGDGASRRRASPGLRLASVLLILAGALEAQQIEGNIAGQIWLADGSFPSERLRVTLEGRGSLVGVTYCESDGRFSFNNLLANSYTVVIDADGYEPVRLPVVVNPVTAGTNIIRVILRPNATERPKGTPEGPAGANSGVVDVAELSRKYPPGVTKEYGAGTKAGARGDSAAAMGHYQAALRLAPDFYPARNDLGTLFLKRGDLKAAEREFRQVLEQNRNFAPAYFNLGDVLFLTRRNAEAKETLGEGLRREPGSAFGHYLLGSVQVRLGELRPAEEQLKTARELDRKMPQVPLSLAALYLQTGRDHEAAAMFELFLKQFPMDPMVPKVRAALSKIAPSTSP